MEARLLRCRDIATYSTGINASFNGVSFSEITGLSWSYAGESIGRGSIYIPSPGSVTIACLGAVSSGTVGVRGIFSCSGGGTAFSAYGVCATVGATAALNGVTTCSMTINFVD